MSESDEPAEGLPREEPATSTSERARHWADFYTELIGYEERILDAMRTLSAGMSAREMDAVRKTNLEPLENLIEDFRRRLACGGRASKRTRSIPGTRIIDQQAQAAVACGV